MSEYLDPILESWEFPITEQIADVMLAVHALGRAANQKYGWREKAEKKAPILKRSLGSIDKSVSGIHQGYQSGKGKMLKQFPKLEKPMGVADKYIGKAKNFVYGGSEKLLRVPEEKRRVKPQEAKAH